MKRKRKKEKGKRKKEKGKKEKSNCIYCIFYFSLETKQICKNKYKKLVDI
jgi:ribosomal protein S26